LYQFLQEKAGLELEAIFEGVRIDGPTLNRCEKQGSVGATMKLKILLLKKIAPLVK